MDIRDHGGIFGGGGGSSDKFPIRYRKLASDGVKKGDKLAFNGKGEVVKLSDWTFDGIIKDMGELTNTPIPTYGKNIYSPESGIKVLNYDSYVFTVRAIQGSSVILQAIYFDYNSVSKVSSEFIVDSGTNVLGSHIAVAKMPNSRIFISYIKSKSSSNYEIHGKIVDVSNAESPYIVDSTVLSSGTDNTLERFYEIKPFVMPDGSIKLYYMTSFSYGGTPSLKYILVNTSGMIDGVFTYSGTITSSINGFARNCRFLIYSETETTTTLFALVKGYSNVSIAYILKTTINHENDTFTMGTALNFALDNYVYEESAMISHDKNYIFLYTIYSGSDGITLTRYDIVGGELSSTAKRIYPGSPYLAATSSKAYGANFQHIAGDKYLMTIVSNANTQAKYRLYQTIVDTSIITTKQNLTFYDLGLVYSNGNPMTMTRISEFPYFFHFGIMGSGTEFTVGGFIDFDIAPVVGIAQQNGGIGETIKVMQPTTHE